jgi:hypothetical protein
LPGRGIRLGAASNWDSTDAVPTAVISFALSKKADIGS